VVDILEDLAFDSLWMSDSRVGHALDPMAALAFAAGRTRRLKLGTNVVVLPGRDPVPIARQMALIDQLSAGRLLPAFGLGKPLEGDPSPIEVKRGERARMFEENLAFIRQLWEQDGGVPYPGGGPPVTIHPRPTRPLEVWFGGRSDRALRRAGRLSDGWIGNFLMPEEVGAALKTIHDAAAAVGRQIEQDHFGTTFYYVRDRRSRFALKHVTKAMAYCGCYVPGPTDCPPRFEQVMLPLGEDEICELVGEYVKQGLSKFVMIPADIPASWEEELTWLRKVTAQLEN
jgi:probable F420-dependent oxidoreductase